MLFISNSDEKVVASKQNGKGTTNNVGGIEVKNITPQIRQAYRIPNNINGVMVSSVSKDGAAQKAGLEVDNIIAQIEDVVINNVNDFNNAMKKYKNTPKRLLVYNLREGSKTIVLN